jgi:hypothetical protein
VIAPDDLPPTAVARMLRDLRPYRVSLAAPHDVRRAICGHFARAFADVSVDGLHARHPEQSARSNLAPWQLGVLACSLVALAAAVALQPLASMRAVSYLLAFMSLPLIALRVFAACDLLSGRQQRGPSPLPRIADAELPIYTILVPLFREANVLAPLMRALARLDYPAAKLDIKLILEAVDGETIAAAEALDLPGSVEIVMVPDLHPRTKTKALSRKTAVLADRLAQPCDRLFRLDGARSLRGPLARWLSPHRPSAADAALLAPDLGRRLSRAVAIRDQAVHLGEDRARACPQHGAAALSRLDQGHLHWT